jgi:hypothetical protein
MAHHPNGVRRPRDACTVKVQYAAIDRPKAWSIRQQSGKPKNNVATTDRSFWCSWPQRQKRLLQLLNAHFEPFFKPLICVRHSSLPTAASLPESIQTKQGNTVTKDELRAELERQEQRYKDVYGGEITTYAAQPEPERKPWRKRASLLDQSFKQELQKMEKELKEEP